MDRLPLEVKHMLTQELCQVSPNTLRALWQVNRHWNQIRVFQLLNADLILPHVRRLTLVARHPRLGRMGTDRKLVEYLAGTPADEFNLPPLGFYQGDWTPIIQLVQQLDCLQQCNLMFHADDLSGLLDALAAKHPLCRVSVTPLCNYAPPTGLARGKWIHSPMLDTVRVLTHENHNAGPYIEHPDRVLRDLLRQATHIRRLALQIIATSNSESWGWYQRWLHSQPSEGDEAIDGSGRRAQLQSLSLPLTSKLTTEQFRAWSRVTDLNHLTAWTAGGIEDVSLLASIAEEKPFQRLQRLTLSLRPPESNTASWSSGAVRAMFDTLPPLAYLCLLGTYDPGWVPSAVLDRHGPTLAELQLHLRPPPYQQYELFRLTRNKGGQIAPVFSAEVIAQMATLCPVLRTLRICVQRHRGHPRETAAYEALGRFPALETLYLHLNCLPIMVPGHGTPFPPRELSAYEREPLRTASPWNDDDVPKWTVRDAVINSAFDEALATAIFRRIRGDGSRGPLRLLRLLPVAGWFEQYQRPTGITARALLGGGKYHVEMGGAWLVKCDEARDIQAKNLKKTSRRGKQSKREMRAADVGIFESIWPSQEEEDPSQPRFWPLKWQSWPLQ
ncbi:hypothetical protein BO86DRAFT_434467 [Aspergillus japonicus CBS 114.51]|uniref:Uncharacterized protein n=1 Tax=Aspergillus japonicus CBS 114.51 TaxID=1448312 RepID=A0A8T8XD68_ASPJA|nr:hypothetical protein BO86DRAFT_434467 [Aspergillus japonicus CBS 114.51]RAH85981.1 hypothetical protein BO86DRAFT_434467 [Aspergillus japonicus CBS 114.51]